MNEDLRRKYALRPHEYDRIATSRGWHPEAIFGLAFEYLQPGQTVLDIGIGTGLASASFHKAGLRIKGMDVSSEMLAICRAKGFADELIERSATDVPYPFESGTIDHMICTGVLHMFADAGFLFAEALRLLRAGGTLSFTELYRPEGASSECHMTPGGSDSEDRVTIYRRDVEEIRAALGDDFVLCKFIEFPLEMGRDENLPIRARGYVARKEGKIHD